MKKCVFIGYPKGYKGWKFYNPKTKKVIISERADFDERYNYEGAVLSTEPELRPLIPIEGENDTEAAQPEGNEEPEVEEQQPEPVPAVIDSDGDDEDDDY